MHPPYRHAPVVKLLLVNGCSIRRLRSTSQSQRYTEGKSHDNNRPGAQMVQVSSKDNQFLMELRHVV